MLDKYPAHMSVRDIIRAEIKLKYPCHHNKTIDNSEKTAKAMEKAYGE